jgi:hypothetical protein
MNFGGDLTPYLNACVAKRCDCCRNFLVAAGTDFAQLRPKRFIRPVNHFHVLRLMWYIWLFYEVKVSN